jgi:hypothetical protein
MSLSFLAGKQDYSSLSIVWKESGAEERNIYLLTLDACCSLD